MKLRQSARNTAACGIHMSEQWQRNRLMQRKIFDVTLILALTFLVTSFISIVATEVSDCVDPGKNVREGPGNVPYDAFIALFAQLDSVDAFYVSLWRDPYVRAAFVMRAKKLWDALRRVKVVGEEAQNDCAGEDMYITRF